MDRFALDIETIPVVDDPDFDDPSHWIPFAVALGHRGADMTNPDVDVLFRTESSIEAEAQLMTDTIDWIADRSDGRDREILTYNGESYDIPIIKHRAGEIRNDEPGANICERLKLLLDSSVHVDLILEMREREGHWVSLDDALCQHSIETDDPEFMGDKVTGADMPSMGRELLANRPDGVNDDLRDAVYRYASSDVAPLFDLHDQLRAEQLR